MKSETKTVFFCDDIDCEQTVLIREFEDRIEGVIQVYNYKYVAGKSPVCTVTEKIWYTRTINKNERTEDSSGGDSGP